LVPNDEKAIAKLVQLAGSDRLRICPVGTGSNFAADYEPSDDFIFLLMNRMNQLIELKPLDAILTVSAGVLISDLSEKMKGSGFELPPEFIVYPGTLAGALLSPDPVGARHDGFRRRLLSVQLVDPQGQILRVGADVIKNVAGYDYWTFLIGCGGRFGVVTRLSLNVEKMPSFQSIPLSVRDADTSDDPNQWIYANLCKGLDPNGIFAR
ncbi:MAG: FAD-binding oxidoreductase, partial [bacterium]